MFDEDDESELEALGGSPDPVVAAAGLFEHHPLFPRADGSPETRDIRFVSFCRRRTDDQVIQNSPEDIPAREVKSWAQVVEWWGGGEYKAIAKDAKHRMIAYFPSVSREWLVFDGDSKPFMLRNGKGYRAPTSTAATAAQPLASAPAPAPAPVPPAQDRLLGVMTEVLHELRNPRVAPPPAPANDGGALVAMIQANAQIMQTVLTVVGQRPAEVARSAEPTALALQLIGAVRQLVPAPVVQPGLAEQIPLIRALRDLGQPAAPTNELQPFVDMFGQVIAADAARTQAEAARGHISSRPQEPPARPSPPRPRPPLVHVPGVGMVEVVAPDAGALRGGEMSIEERAAAIRKDPALLRELGLGLPPPSAVAPATSGVTAQPAPAAAPASPVRAAVVESVPAIPTVPDLELPPVVVAAAPSPVSSSTVFPAPSVVATVPPESAPVATPAPVPAAPPAAPHVVASAAPELATNAAPLPVSTAPAAAPSVVSTAPPERTTIAAPAPVSTAPPAIPSVVAAQRVEPPANAPEEHPPILLPARMPVAPPLAPEDERQRAIGELTRLTSLTHEDRVAALRKLPGIGDMADDVAHAMASLPPDAVAAMASTLDLHAIGALAGRSNGIAGG